MNLKELTDLIAVRDYIESARINPVLDRPTVSELNGMLILLDKKIINILKDKKFKQYIGYDEVKKAIVEAAQISNIKFGLKK